MINKMYLSALLIFLAACTSTEEPANDAPIDKQENIGPDTSRPGQPVPAPDSTLNEDTLAHGADQKSKAGKRSFTVPMVVEVVKEEPVPDQMEMRENVATDNWSNQTVDAVAPPNPSPAPEKPRNEVFEFVAEMPKYKMGDLAEFFSRNMKYPELAYESAIQGKVYIRCIVNEEGTIEPGSVQVYKGLKGGGAGLDDEAVRLVKLIPPKAFSPAMSNGTPVRTFINLPVKFVLE
jgi:TonB family protein